MQGLYEIHLISRTMADLATALEKVPTDAIRPRLGEARTRYSLSRWSPSGFEALLMLSGRSSE
jgi:hypothetical protein